MVFDGPDACLQAALAMMRQTGRPRALVSGSLNPDWLQQMVDGLTAGGAHLNDPDPDPLGFEDLLSQVAPDMACVIVQNPSYFGNRRDLTALTSECREWEVPLLVIDTAVSSKLAAAQSLATALGRVAGVRLITDDFIDRFSLYLGEEVDAADVLDQLHLAGIQNCEAAALAYPAYPELRPVLIVNAPQDATLLCEALANTLRLR